MLGGDRIAAAVCRLGAVGIGLIALWGWAQEEPALPKPWPTAPSNEVLIRWGESSCPTGDEQVLTDAPWGAKAWKSGGEWVPEVPMWRVCATNDEGSLFVSFDRDLMTNDLACRLTFYDFSEPSSLFLDLLATNGTPVVTNLTGGNLMLGSNQVRSVETALWLGAYPEVRQVRVRRGAGEIAVMETLLYVPAVSVAVDEQEGGSSAGTSEEVSASTGLGTNGNGQVSGEAGSHDPGQADPVPEVESPNSRAIYVDHDQGDDCFDGLANLAATGHGPKRTIAAGMNAADPGDTVYVAAGEYAESVRNTKVRMVAVGHVVLR